MYLNLLVFTVLVIILNYEKIITNIVNKYEESKYENIYIYSLKNKIYVNDISKNSIELIIFELNHISEVKQNTTVNLIINSNGGSYLDGIELVEYIINSNLTFNCYAINAKSAAFTIFQFCKNRYVTTKSVLFQHNQKITLEGSFESFENWFDNRFFILKSLSIIIKKEICKRIKMNYKEYNNRISNDWEIRGGKEILNFSLADKIVNIKDLKYVNTF